MNERQTQSEHLTDLIHRGLPISVNYHLNKNCNFRCKGCYATFDDAPTMRVMLPKQKMFEIVRQVALAPLPTGESCRKLTFAGGEPTLCPWLPDLITHAKSMGLVTMLITNGSRLDQPFLRHLSEALDWLTISIDSFCAETNQRIGRVSSRGEALCSGRYADLLVTARELGMRTKINTVVNAYNWTEDFSSVLNGLTLDRWKILQVTPVAGQNDQFYKEMAVTQHQFDSFVSRHLWLESTGTTIVPESTNDIRCSYVMIDPLGRFFDSSTGRHRYSRSILEIGLAAAFAQVRFDPARFEERGGRYDFRPSHASSLPIEKSRNRYAFSEKRQSTRQRVQF